MEDLNRTVVQKLQDPYFNRLVLSFGDPCALQENANRLLPRKQIDLVDLLAVDIIFVMNSR